LQLGAPRLTEDSGEDVIVDKFTVYSELLKGRGRWGGESALQFDKLGYRDLVLAGEDTRHCKIS
jgi:hypothetical protein